MNVRRLLQRLYRGVSRARPWDQFVAEQLWIPLELIIGPGSFSTLESLGQQHAAGKIVMRDVFGHLGEPAQSTGNLPLDTAVGLGASYVEFHPMDLIVQPPS